MSQVSNHEPEVLAARRCHNPETPPIDMDELLMELDYASGLWFHEDEWTEEYLDEWSEWADQEEARVLEELRRAGVVPF